MRMISRGWPAATSTTRTAVSAGGPSAAGTAWAPFTPTTSPVPSLDHAMYKADSLPLVVRRVRGLALRTISMTRSSFSDQYASRRPSGDTIGQASPIPRSNTGCGSLSKRTLSPMAGSLTESRLMRKPKRSSNTVARLGLGVMLVVATVEGPLPHATTTIKAARTGIEPRSRTFIKPINGLRLRRLRHRSIARQVRMDDFRSYLAASLGLIADRHPRASGSADYEGSRRGAIVAVTRPPFAG